MDYLLRLAGALAVVPCFIIAFVLAALVQPLPRRFPQRGAGPAVTAAAGRGILVSFPERRVEGR